jgi:hypothetical protein
MNKLKSLSARLVILPARERSVRKVSEYHLYELAVAAHPLTEIQQAKYSEVWWKWLNARTALENLYKQRQLEFIDDCANRLYSAINAVVPQKFDDAFDRLTSLANPEPVIPVWQVNAITSAAQEFETVLRTELNQADTYFIDSKGTHKTSVLLNEAHRELPPSVVSDIPEVVADFDQAGKCLLFDNSTAVGFHLMRAIETAIYKYLKDLTGKDVPVKSRNWRVYVKALEKSGADAKVVGTIQHIKDAYRNPILHPEVTLDGDEAPALFGWRLARLFRLQEQSKNQRALR